jgi:phosphatidylserine decarboxylase
MAPSDLQSPSTTAFIAPGSVQPGGGLCMKVELAWGRLRRAWLRRVRPEYVRRMAQLRQGQCANCPHDIIDPRDLKFQRNVCGHWFREEDDSFRWRGRLGLARAGLAEVVLGSISFLIIGLGLGFAACSIDWIFWLPVGILGLLWLFLISFFRDPERTIPSDPRALVSPADGTVTHVDEVPDADFPGGRALRISIFLSIFNVHVNRVPRTARVVSLRYLPGAFLDARHPDCSARNEQLWIDFRESDSQPLVRVKQIGGAIARRIVCWLKVGEEVKIGERFGMIKFGSRTEVLLPASQALDVQVKVGDKVKGGSTLLLRYL